MIKRYTTIDGTLINEESIGELEDYHIEFIDPENDEVQKIEMHHARLEIALEHYLKPNETVESVFNSYKEKYTSILITRRTALGSMTKHETWEYHDNQLLFRYNTLYDANKETVCNQRLDPQTEQPDYERTSKELSVNGEVLLEADYGHYDKHGNLITILFMSTDNEQDWESYTSSDLGKLENILGLDLSYYLHARLDP